MKTRRKPSSSSENRDPNMKVSSSAKQNKLAKRDPTTTLRSSVRFSSEVLKEATDISNKEDILNEGKGDYSARISTTSVDESTFHSLLKANKHHYSTPLNKFSNSSSDDSSKGDEKSTSRRLRARKRMAEIGNVDEPPVSTKLSTSKTTSVKKLTEKRNVSKKEKSSNVSKTVVHKVEDDNSEEVQRQRRVEQMLIDDFDDVNSFELCIE